MDYGVTPTNVVDLILVPNMRKVNKTIEDLLGH